MTVCLGLACLVFLLFGDYLKLSGFLISLLLIILPRYLYENSKKFQAVFEIGLIFRTQLLIALAVYFNLLGSLAFYHFNPTTWWYDSFAHFINPVIIFSLTAILAILWQKKFFKRSSLPLTIGLNFLLIIILAFAWEFYESIIDSLFDSAYMFGQDGEVFFDTLTDLGADLAGGIGASILLYNNLYKYFLRQLKI